MHLPEGVFVCMKISLAIIAGNVAHYLPRFLDSFGPWFDEIIVVRAIGSQEPDETMQIAKDRRCITSVYHNQPERADWPHVDDFAAARNLAWKLASGDYIAWADTDDVFDCTTEEWSALRKRIARERPDVVSLPYNVPEDQLTVIRERIVKRDLFHWVFPIHENLHLKNPEHQPHVIVEQRPRWRHAQNPDRRANDERNLRILESIPESERTLSQLFHIWQSMRALGRIQEGIAIAQQALKHPDIGPDEGYELLINIAQVATNPHASEQYLLQAINAVPYRREALGEMISCKIRLGRPLEALSYAEMMMALSPPPEYIWNARGKFYGWLAVHLHAMALRANDQFAKADAIELNHFKAHGAKISLLHATRGRPQKAAASRRLWLNRAADPDAVEHIFALDADDTDSTPLAVFRHIIQNKIEGHAVGAWNLAAHKASGQILVQLNDDFIPPMHWDKMILAAFGDQITEPRALRVSDGHRTDEQLCIAIITRPRLEQQGFFLHPRFKSVFSDDYFSWSAWRDGIVIDARHIVIEHDHPFFNGGQGWDQTYAAHNSKERYLEGEAIYKELTAKSAA